MKTAKKYIIICDTHRTGAIRETRPLTIKEAIDYFEYTLMCGQSWQHERGNKKINRNPKTINSLISNLNNAVNNSAMNGYAGRSYSFKEV